MHHSSGLLRIRLVGGIVINNDDGTPPPNPVVVTYMGSGPNARSLRRMAVPRRGPLFLVSDFVP